MSYASQLSVNTNAFKNLTTVSTTPKRRANETDNSHLVNRPLQKKQVRHFDSTNPNSASKTIDLTDDFTVKLSKKQIQAKNKQSQNDRYVKSVGTSNNDENFKTRERTFSVYIGSIHNDMSAENVSAMISTRVKFNNLVKLNTTHGKFQSFKFNINYLDKDVISKKEIWPRGLIINRYHFKNTNPTANNNNNMNTGKAAVEPQQQQFRSLQLQVQL